MLLRHTGAYDMHDPLWTPDAQAHVPINPRRDGAPSAQVHVLRLAIADLIKALRAAMQEEYDCAEEHLYRVGATLGQELPWRDSRIDSPHAHSQSWPIVKGGLAPRHIRQLTTHIEGHIEGTLRIKDLAALVELSPSHFCRAFKESYGDGPHEYIMRRRIERAQGLMLATTDPLGQIAVACGLADQAHLNKLFRRFVGESPLKWRRARTTYRE
jgi:AraC family transcriptional regulator